MHGPREPRPRQLSSLLGDSLRCLLSRQTGSIVASRFEGALEATRAQHEALFKVHVEFAKRKSNARGPNSESRSRSLRGCATGAASEDNPQRRGQRLVTV